MESTVVENSIRSGSGNFQLRALSPAGQVLNARLELSLREGVEFVENLVFGVIIFKIMLQKGCIFSGGFRPH